MPTTKLETYIGSGAAFLRRKNVSNAPWIAVGNTSKLAIEWKTSEKTLMDYLSRAGGAFDMVTLIEGADITMEITQLTAENLRRMAFGTSSDTVAGTVTDESHVWAGSGPVLFDRIPSSAASILVKDDTGATTYVLGVDYDLMEGFTGIIIRPTGSAIASGDELKITYAAKADVVIQTLTTTAEEYEMRITGLNKADPVDGDPRIIHLHRVKFGPGGLNIITDDFDKVSLKGSALKDPNVTGTGQSPYAYIRKAA